MSPSAPVPRGNTSKDKNNEQNAKRRTPSPTSTQNSTQNSPSAATINLTREYTLAIQSDSYNEIWSAIHHPQTPQSILRPNQSSADELIRSARPTRLTRLVSLFLQSSEQASNLFLSLRRSVDLAREIYAPISLLLDDILPAESHTAFDTFLDFNSRSNPFQDPAGFGEIRDCFSVLKQQLEVRVAAGRRRQRRLRRATIAAAACLVGAAAGAAAAAVVLAGHALLGVAAAGFCCGGGDWMAGRRRELRATMRAADAAARETYVLDKHLSTVERLVARLHAAVESDRVLVRLGIERGRGQIYTMQEIVRQLRKNYSSFCCQLTDLDEHICLCLAAVNRARFLLLQQIQSLGSTR